ncbi:MAG: phosphoethanolamine--lipid A transferase [Thiolinea sp.]
MKLTPVWLTLLVATFIALFDNLKLWSALNERIDLLSWSGFGYLVSIFLLIVTVTGLITLIFGQWRLLKPVLILVTVVSAILAYFTDQLGVVFDAEMLRNVVDNLKENNTQEAKDLLSGGLIIHLLIFAGIPVAFILWTKVQPQPLVKGLLTRSGVAVVLIALTVGSMLANFKFTTYFSRENRDLRLYVTPVFPLLSAHKLYAGMNQSAEQPFTSIDDATRQQTSDKKIVGIMVVGETARADHFSLNGYPRKTNPLLEQQADLINFRKTSSCGTSTAYSVPCMFSFLSRDDYSPDAAALQSNSLDVLKSTGIKVRWLENNSGCKGVCDRLGAENTYKVADEEMAYDEYLLTALEKELAQVDSDTLIVMHMLGSHGPTYYKRYPADQTRFKPYCAQNAPQDCDEESIINAYDNTIAYTDYILDGIIKRLNAKQDQFGSFMLYASDHGESLGEGGIYLHGLPYSLAPEAQTHVPMMFWSSAAYRDAGQLDIDQLRRKQDQPVSHDFLSHTLLGAFGVSSKVYQAELDLLNQSKEIRQALH